MAKRLNGNPAHGILYPATLPRPFGTFGTAGETGAVMVGRVIIADECDRVYAETQSAADALWLQAFSDESVKRGRRVA